MSPGLNLDPSLVKILTQTNDVAGMGFVINETHIVTCAHVINIALNHDSQDSESKVGQTIILDFPRLPPDQRRPFEAIVEHWSAPPAGGDGDIAGLKLLEPLPTSARPVLLAINTNLWGDPCAAFGYPEGLPGGEWIKAELRHNQGDDLLQIVGTQEGFFPDFLKPGYSGGPVWDERLQCVVGMVARIDDETEAYTGYAIPAQTLAENWNMVRLGRPEQTPYVFISYCSQDKTIAKNIEAYLGDAGVVIWPEPTSIENEQWELLIKQGIRASSAFIAVYSSAYAETTYCADEITTANQARVPIFTAMLGPVDANKLYLPGISLDRAVQFPDTNDEIGFRAACEELIRLLRIDGQFEDIPDSETRYLNNLYHKLINEADILTDSGYVHLAAQTRQQVERTVRPLPPKTWKTDRAIVQVLSESVDDSTNASGPEYREIKLDNILDVTMFHSRFVLLGSPGCGKTTTLKQWALQAIQNRHRNKRTAPIPIWLELREWGPGRDALDFAYQSFDAKWRITRSNFEAMLAENNLFIFFVDGLNEMGRGPLGRANWKRLRRWIQSDDGPRNVILACRDTDYDEQLDLQLPRVLLQELDIPRIERFVENYLPDHADEFLQLVMEFRVDGSNSLAHLAKNPFWLSALIEIYKAEQQKHERELPRNPGELLDKIVEMLWNREWNRNTSGWIPHDQMRTAFSKLAYTIIDENKPLQIPINDAVKQMRQNSTLSLVEAEGLFEAGTRANLMSIQDNQIRFYHQLLLEYFAALSLTEISLSELFHPKDYPDKHYQPVFSRFTGTRRANKWDNTLIALAGLAPNPDQVISELATVDPWLAGICLQSGVRASQEKMRLVTWQLCRQLSAQNVTQRLVSAQMLDSLGIFEEHVPALLRASNDPSPKVRTVIARILGQVVDYPEPYEKVMGLLEDSDAEVRIAAIHTLGNSNNPEVIERLHGYFNDSDPYVQEAAVTVLRNLGQPEYETLLILRGKLTDQEPAERLEATRMLGELGYTEVLPELLKILNDDDMQVRLAGIEAVARIGDLSSIPVLYETLKDESSFLREAVIDALAEFHDHSCLPVFLAAIDDEQFNVRDAAKRAIVQMGTAIIADLIELLRSRDVFFYSFIKIALRELGAEATPSLVEILDDPNSDIRALAASTLEGMQWEPATEEEDIKYLAALKNWELCAEYGEAAVPVLIEYIDDEDTQNIRQIIHQLSIIRSSEAVPKLTEVVQNGLIEVRRVAIHALGEIADSFAIDALVKTLSDEFETIRNTTAHALGRLGWTPTAPNEQARFAVAKKDWGVCVELGADSVPALVAVLHGPEPDHDIRRQAAKVLRQIGWEPETAIDELIYTIALGSWEDVTAHGARAIPELLKEIAHVSVKDRCAIIKAFGEIGNPIVVPELVNMFESSIPEVRRGVVQSLGKLGGDEALGILLKALDDPNPYVRNAASVELCQIGRPAVPGLIDILETENHPVRRLAFRTILQIGAQAVPDLSHTLLIGSLASRQTAAFLLGKIADPEAIPSLLDVISNEETYHIRQIAKNAIGQMGDAALEYLAEALSSQELGMRRAAISCFRYLKLDADHTIPQTLMDESIAVRHAAGQALIQIDWQPPDDTLAAWFHLACNDWKASVLQTEAAIPALVFVINNDDLLRRRRAARTLSLIESPAAIGVFLELLDDSDVDLRRRALQALGQSGDTRLIPKLKPLMGDDDAGIRKIAAVVLADLGWTPADVTEQAQQYVALQDWHSCIALQEGAVPALLDVLQDHLLHVKREAANALHEIGWQPTVTRDKAEYHIMLRQWDHCVEIGSDAIPALLRHFGESNTPQIRAKIAHMLGLIGSPTVTDVLEQSMLNDVALVRQASAYALGRICDPKAIPSLIKALLDPSQGVRSKAFAALQQFGSPTVSTSQVSPQRDRNRAISGVVKELFNTLESDNYTLEKTARRLVAAIGVDAVPALCDILLYNSQRSRKIAIYCLTEIGDPTAIPSLVHTMCYDAPLNYVAHRAIRTMGSAAIAALTQTLIRNRDFKIRRTSASLLAEIDDPRATQTLIEVVNSEDEIGSEIATRALNKLSNKRLEQHLALLDNQTALYISVGNWEACISQGEAAVPGLLEALDHPRIDIRRSAAHALGIIGDPSVADALVDKLYAEESPDVRKNLIVALGEMKATQAVPSLLKFLETSPIPNIRWNAAIALNRIGDTSAIQGLQAASKDPHSRVRSLATEAHRQLHQRLKKREAKQAVENLRKELPEKISPEVEELAEMISDELGETEAKPRQLILHIVAVCGIERATGLFHETLEIEASGGIMLPSGERRRTPGGVFIFLAKEALPPPAKKLLFSQT